MKKFFTLLFAFMAVVSINADDGLYLVGDATTIGWSGDLIQRQLTRMRETSTGVYEWTGLLKHGGEGFKIQEGNSSWNVRYCPSSANFAITQEGGTDTFQSANDWKWNPSNENWQWYTITVNKNNSTLSWQAANPTLLVADGDGYFNIGTPEELNTLAFMCRNNVNNENYKVRLTADIDYTAYKNGSLDAIGLFEDFPFRGEFDGQNHTVTVDLASSYSTRFSFFGTVIGKVHHLKLAGKITATNSNQTAGLCGLLKVDGSKIYNCISTVEIIDSQSGDGTIGGFCAVTYNSVSIENCAFYGKISAPNRDGNGGIVGWAESHASTTIKNCLIVADINWNTGSSNNDDFGRHNPSVINSFKVDASDETLTDGQMTYKLNNYVSGADDWFQTLGTDAMPSPLSTSEKLYANGTFYCDGVTSKGGDVVLSNTDEAVVDPHVFGEDGICTGCHAIGQEPVEDAGVFQIASPGNLMWFAQYVNAGHPGANAVLTSDIDMSNVNYTPAGTTDNRYEGTFDGQNHAVTLALKNSDQNYQGLFGIATDGVTIKNVIVRGYVTGKSFVAGIVGGSNGSVEGKTLNIINCGNEATITATGANAGSIIGVNMGSAAHFFISNCYNVGNVTSGYEGGAITGWTGGDISTIENTYNIGVIKNGENLCLDFIRGGGQLSNCYSMSATDPLVTSGELAYKLGAAFSQLIGTDAYPVFGSAAVNYVGAEGYATLYDATTGYELNGDVKAYAATFNTNWIDLAEVENVPVGTPVILQGSYYNKLAADLDAINIANDLKGADADIAADGTIYVLAKQAEKAGFAQAEADVAAGEVYMVIAHEGAKAFYPFGKENATSIKTIDNGQQTTEGIIYNLAGQRVQKMQNQRSTYVKGINIVNGKKILF